MQLEKMAKKYFQELQIIKKKKKRLPCRHSEILIIDKDSQAANLK